MPATVDVSERLMLVGPERIFYAGLLGKPVKRSLGALAISVAPEGDLALDVDGTVTHCELYCIDGYVPHSVVSSSRSVLGILIEPESISDEARDALIARCRDPLQAQALAQRIRAAYAALCRHGSDGFTSQEFDDLFLGETLAPRQIDARIAATLAQFHAQPHKPMIGEECAAAAGLSLSRFLHLFKDQTGVSFRALRAWKRARNVLRHVNVETNFAYFALDAGYPDSTHFSHSVRKIYGLQPSAIFSGSRRLKIFSGAEAAAG